MMLVLLLLLRRRLLLLLLLLLELLPKPLLLQLAHLRLLAALNGGERKVAVALRCRRGLPPPPPPIPRLLVRLRQHSGPLRRLNPRRFRVSGEAPFGGVLPRRARAAPRRITDAGAAAA